MRFAQFVVESICKIQHMSVYLYLAVSVSVALAVSLASSMSAALMLSVEKSTISVRRINQLKNLKQQHFYIFIGVEHFLFLSFLFVPRA